jgi:hypothetical protein
VSVSEPRGFGSHGGRISHCGIYEAGCSLQPSLFWTIGAVGQFLHGWQRRCQEGSQPIFRWCRKSLPGSSASANISAFRETTMSAERIFLVGFGALSLLFVCLLGRQILRRQLVSMKQRRNALGSAEGVVLLAITIITGTRYCLELVHPAGHGSLPELAWGWIAAFATGCAIYVGTKAMRVLRTKNK